MPIPLQFIFHSYLIVWGNKIEKSWPECWQNVCVRNAITSTIYSNKEQCFTQMHLFFFLLLSTDTPLTGIFLSLLHPCCPLQSYFISIPSKQVFYPFFPPLGSVVIILFFCFFFYLFYSFILQSFLLISQIHTCSLTFIFSSIYFIFCLTFSCSSP